MSAERIRCSLKEDVVLNLNILILLKNLSKRQLKIINAIQYTELGTDSQNTKYYKTFFFQYIFKFCTREHKPHVVSIIVVVVQYVWLVKYLAWYL